MHYLKKIMCICIYSSFFGEAAFAQQDTLKINYKQAEAILLKENLSIISSQYDVQISEAQVLQSKAWVNPYLHWNQDMYSVEKNSYFAYRKQALIQVDQTFSIAGKHTNTVKLARVNVDINRFMMMDVTRSLIYEMGIQFNNLHASQSKSAVYEDVLNSYKKRIDAAEKMYGNGSLAGNELLRLKSEKIALEFTAMQNQLALLDAMGSLKVMLNIKPEVQIFAVVSEYQSFPMVNLLELYNNSLIYRPDYQMALRNIVYNETNLQLQKSIAVPDINVGYQPLDRGSNYVRTYSGLVVEFSLPFLNRNTGNISMARYGIEKATSQKEQKENQINNEINSTYLQLICTQNILNNYTDTFKQSIEVMNVNANTNYLKKNISLIEYIDMQRIYLENKLQFIELQNTFRQSALRINFVVGKETINP